MALGNPYIHANSKFREVFENFHRNDFFHSHKKTVFCFAILESSSYVFIREQKLKLSVYFWHTPYEDNLRRLNPVDVGRTSVVGQFVPGPPAQIKPTLTALWAPTRKNVYMLPAKWIR